MIYIKIPVTSSSLNSLPSTLCSTEGHFNKTHLSTCEFKLVPKLKCKSSPYVVVNWAALSFPNQTLAPLRPSPHGGLTAVKVSVARPCALQCISSFCLSPHLDLQWDLSPHHCHMAGFHQDLSMEDRAFVQTKRELVWISLLPCIPLNITITTF